MPAMPGAGRPDPQAQSPQSPGAAPQGGGQGPSPAAQAVAMIQHGYQALGQIIQQAGKSLPPQDVQLFQSAAKATEAFIEAISGAAQGGDQGGEEAQGPQAPIPGHAAPNSRPSNF